MGRKRFVPVPMVEQNWYHAIPLSVAADLWDVPSTTLIRWANEDKIAAWKPGVEWFVSVLSMVRLKGKCEHGARLLAILPQIR